MHHSKFFLGKNFIINKNLIPISGGFFLLLSNIILQKNFFFWPDGIRLNLLPTNLQIVAHATTKILSALAPYVYYNFNGQSALNPINAKITRNAIYAERLEDRIILKAGPVYIHGTGDVYPSYTISVLR